MLSTTLLQSSISTQHFIAVFGDDAIHKAQFKLDEQTDLTGDFSRDGSKDKVIFSGGERGLLHYLDSDSERDIIVFISHIFLHCQNSQSHCNLMLIVHSEIQVCCFSSSFFNKVLSPKQKYRAEYKVW